MELGAYSDTCDLKVLETQKKIWNIQDNSGTSGKIDQKFP